MDVYDFGDDTGCARTAPTAEYLFQEIYSWMLLPENDREVLFIKLELKTGDNVSFHHTSTEGNNT